MLKASGSGGGDGLKAMGNQSGSPEKHIVCLIKRQDKKYLEPMPFLL
jgi:hypothetical protein